MKFEDALKKHVLVMDGAMGTMVQNLDVTNATNDSEFIFSAMVDNSSGSEWMH